MDLNKELKQRLKNKIEEKKNNRIFMKKKEIRDLNNQVEDEMKTMEKDPRITPIMKNWFLQAMNATRDRDVKYPVYILDNLESEKVKFYDFLVKYMEIVDIEMNDWKNGYMDGYNKLKTEYEKEEYMTNLNNEYKKKYKTYFTTPYIVYMSLMTGINVFNDLLSNLN
jgi:hypothetical protein